MSLLRNIANQVFGCRMFGSKGRKLSCA